MIDLLTKRAISGHYGASSQGGEDGIIKTVFPELSISEGAFVEFGASDGMLFSNSYHSCVLKDWSGLYIEKDETRYKKCVKNMATFKKVSVLHSSVSLEKGERLDEVLKEYRIENDFRFLSIDIDGYDYWVWADTKSKPILVSIEYSQPYNLPLNVSRVISYDRNYIYESTDYYGASVLALYNLAQYKGYDLVCWTGPGLNLIFIRKDYNLDRFKTYKAEDVEPSLGSKRPSHLHKSTPVDFIYNPCFSWTEQLEGFKIGGKRIGVVNRRFPKG